MATSYPFGSIFPTGPRGQAVRNGSAAKRASPAGGVRGPSSGTGAPGGPWRPGLGRLGTWVRAPVRTRCRCSGHSSVDGTDPVAGPTTSQGDPRSKGPGSGDPHGGLLRFGSEGGAVPRDGTVSSAEGRRTGGLLSAPARCRHSHPKAASAGGSDVRRSCDYSTVANLLLSTG